MNETMKKFGHPETIVREFDRWAVVLRPKQVTLGSLVLGCKEPVTDSKHLIALGPEASGLHVVHPGFDVEAVTPQGSLLRGPGRVDPDPMVPRAPLGTAACAGGCRDPERRDRRVAGARQSCRSSVVQVTVEHQLGPLSAQYRCQGGRVPEPAPASFRGGIDWGVVDQDDAAQSLLAEAAEQGFQPKQLGCTESAGGVERRGGDRRRQPDQRHRAPNPNEREFEERIRAAIPVRGHVR